MTEQSGDSRKRTRAGGATGPRGGDTFEAHPANPDASPLSPIVRASTPELIAHQLREAIAEGHFVAGQQLLESSLAGSLGVSRGPLREAMQRLTQEGLLVGHRNRGLFVMELDEPAVRDMYLARGAVERAAVEHLIGSGRGESARELLAIVDGMRECSGAPRDVSALDMRFHETLVALTGSPRLMRMHGSLVTQVRMCLAATEITYQRIEDRVGEHGALAEAILAKDAKTADQLLVAHMDDGLRRVLDVRHERT
ncbi:GntR family transcriptional regulator [Mobilicoccus caccae]|nr:GntR family transcriptional regulator [Mobilicoccus caccae]